MATESSNKLFRMRRFRAPHLFYVCLGFVFVTLSNPQETFFPTSLTISHSTPNAIKHAAQEGKPKEVGKMPNSIAAQPTVKA